MHLRFNYAGVEKHPITMMRELGITWQHDIFQPIGDQWWFWNCENVPDPLPSFLEVVNWNPMECIGLGLTKEEAEKIRDYK